jgi:hypothetical protein
VIPINEMWFYRLGYMIHPLTELEPPQTFRDIGFKLMGTHRHIETLLSSIILPLHVCRPSAISLRKSIADLIDKYIKGNWDRDIDEVDVQDIINKARDFEAVLAAELETIHTYAATQKLAFDTRSLIDNAENLLPITIRNDVPQETISELREAGRCLAFEVPTASGFHVFRATEGVIRQYFKAVVGSLPEAKNRNWGAYIRTLEKHGADQKVTGFLDHIRQLYRNPVIHPEEHLEIEDAEILLSLCTSAIIQMVKAIQNIQATAVPESSMSLASVTPPTLTRNP